MPRVWKMVTVVERFEQPREYEGNHWMRPMERLSCGHTRVDPFYHYGNETCVKMKRAFEILSPEQPIRARCYECGRAAKTEGGR